MKRGCKYKPPTKEQLDIIRMNFGILNEAELYRLTKYPAAYPTFRNMLVKEGFTYEPKEPKFKSTGKFDWEEWKRLDLMFAA